MGTFTSLLNGFARRCAGAVLLSVAGIPATLAADCAKPLYLTFESGHMDVAPLVAEVLKRQQVRVTFFASNEPTRIGNGSLSNHWAPWWKERATEGHEFASNTYDHVYWRADERSVEPRFRVRPSAGAFAHREFTWDAKKYCEQLAYANERLQDFTGKKPMPLFRAPGGTTSRKLLAAARACGFEHVAVAKAGLLGDDLPSERFSNETLLKKALHDVKPGDVLVAHLGVWTRRDPWAPAVLEPLIVGLKDRGFCFETLRKHPAYMAWIERTERSADNP